MVKVVTFKLCEDSILRLSQLGPSVTARGFGYNDYTQKYLKRILVDSKDKATDFFLRKRGSAEFVQCCGSDDEILIK